MATNNKRKRRLSQAELLDRLPRAFRPKLAAIQVRDLGLLHVSCLDAISRGDASPRLMWDWVSNVLTWSRAAQLMERGEAEMQPQLELAYRVIERYRITGRVEFQDGDYEIARTGQIVMDQFADIIDRPTAEAAAEWSDRATNALLSQASAPEGIAA